MRAFARDIQISPAHLSEVLSGINNLSEKTAEKIAGNLKLSDATRNHFLELVKFDRCDDLEKKSAIKDNLIRITKKEIGYHEIKADEFDVIADWFHLGILSAAELPHLKFNRIQIMHSLGIEPDVFNQAIERLARLELLRCENDLIIPLKTKTLSGLGTPSSAIRHFHRQMLRKASLALDTLPMTERFVSDSMVAVDKTRLPEMMEFLRQVRADFIARFEEKSSADQVCGLTFAVFPVTVEDPE